LRGTGMDNNDEFEMSENGENNLSSVISDGRENFMTSTPQRKKIDCDECKKKSQCVDCYVRKECESEDERLFLMAGLSTDSTPDRVQQVAI
jgi:hypothetical protein